MNSPRPALTVDHVIGDLLDQDVDALVNPWNRNFVPRWLSSPRGVSGQLKAITGPGPWRSLARIGTIPVGAAIVTDGGRDRRKLIHVAGINARWKATPESVTLSTANAVNAALTHGFRSIALPLIGSGHGSMRPAQSASLIASALDGIAIDPAGPQVRVVIVHHDSGTIEKVSEDGR